MGFNSGFKGLNAELNPICHLLALLGVQHILHISRIRVKKDTAIFCSAELSHVTVHCTNINVAVCGDEHGTVCAMEV